MEFSTQTPNVTHTFVYKCLHTHIQQYTYIIIHILYLYIYKSLYTT